MPLQNLKAHVDGFSSAIHCYLRQCTEKRGTGKRDLEKKGHKMGEQEKKGHTVFEKGEKGTIFFCRFIVFLA